MRVSTATPNKAVSPVRASPSGATESHFAVMPNQNIFTGLCFALHEILDGIGLVRPQRRI